ncbi:MAG: hypothetical protein IJI57_08560, partial [Flexilinea sp.]|nr:hypothetical protein [Flexilinea sp.]
MKKIRYYVQFSKRAAVLTAALTLFCINAVPVSADSLGSGHIRSIFEILKDMTDIYIKIAYGAMVLVFVVGTVKSGVGAQAAQT